MSGIVEPSEQGTGPVESVLDDGTRVLFRPVVPDDKWIFVEGLRRLSPESRYRRFFRHIDHFTDEELRYLTEVDGVDHFAWLAVLPDVPRAPGVGVGRWIRLADEPDVAEAAITVIDEYQGRGIGKALLWLLARSAIDRNVRAFRAWVIGDNQPMLTLLGDFGAAVESWDGGVGELTVPLPSDERELEDTPIPRILRAIAAGDIPAAGGRGRAAPRVFFGDDD